MKNWNGKEVKCVDSNGNEVKVGDSLTDFRGDKAIVKSFEAPHKPGAKGRIYVEGGWGYYASVFRCEYVEIE